MPPFLSTTSTSYTMRYHLLDTWSNRFVTLVVVIPPTRSSFQVGKLTPLRPHSLTSYWEYIGVNIYQYQSQATYTTSISKWFLHSQTCH